jgi:hypothetical protein
LFFHFSRARYHFVKETAMVHLYVRGQRIGSLADAEKLIPEYIASHTPVEFREEESGAVLGTFQPQAHPEGPIVPWDPSITANDLERIAAEPGYSFEDVKKRLGWE